MDSMPLLYQRARSPTDAELAGIAWLDVLDDNAKRRAVAAMRVSTARRGDWVCRVGKPVTYWFGLIDGLLMMSRDTEAGRQISYTGVAPGGWFGEGTVLKHEPYRYNINALRDSIVAGIPVETFDWLLNHSIAFNRFVMNQLNERLGQFIAAREIDRMKSPEAQVARTLASLLDPKLYPGVGASLRITQLELAQIAGLSRQRVNGALTSIAQRGYISSSYGEVSVHNLAALRWPTWAESTVGEGV
jgi:CRP/FNR family transcriptional regulator, cyclic AMP receptor protein